MVRCKKTKIVCTMGPSTDSDQVLKELIENGLNVCKGSISHMVHMKNTRREWIGQRG